MLNQMIIRNRIHINKVRETPPVTHSMQYVLSRTFVNKMWTCSYPTISDETQAHLCRHLLKTVCTDITNLVFNAVAADHMMSVQDEAQITPEVVIPCSWCFRMSICFGVGLGHIYRDATLTIFPGITFFFQIFGIFVPYKKKIYKSEHIRLFYSLFVLKKWPWHRSPIVL